MKRFVISVVNAILVGIFFCLMVMAAPPMPDDLQMVQPDPSLPKELAGFWGKWEGNLEFHGRTEEFYVIVEKIDEGKASLYTYRRDSGWVRYEGIVSKEKGQYKLAYSGRSGWGQVTLKGEYLELRGPTSATLRLRRIP